MSSARFLSTLNPDGVKIIFEDANGDAFTPNGGLVWSLTDDLGNVINGRSDVALTPAEEIDIVFDAADLVIANNTAYRIFYLSGTYSSNLGTQNIDEKLYFRLEV